MPTEEPLYWPYPVLPVEQQTEEHRRRIRFLDAALDAGFRPCVYPPEVYFVRSDEPREGWLVWRGRTRQGATRWEVWLDETAGRAAAFWADDFDTAAASVLAWLRGGDVVAVVKAAQPHIIRGPMVNAPAVAVSRE